MGNYSILYMFQNPRRGRQERKFTTNVSKILDLKSSSEQILSENWRWVPLIVYRYADHNKSGFTVGILFDNFIFTVFNIAPCLKQITLFILLLPIINFRDLTIKYSLRKNNQML